VAAAESVRLLVVVDWDVGFPLTSRPRELPDVAPGDAYVTEVFPQRAVAIHEVLTEGFALVKISAGDQTGQASVETVGPRRLYRLGAPLAVDAGGSVFVHLCNDADAPRKQKDVTIIRCEPTTRPQAVAFRPERVNIEPGPSEDRVVMIEGVDNRCGICGQTFRLTPDDPHASLIERALKNAGQGPICPTERKA
jgi:hypothetical protein